MDGKREKNLCMSGFVDNNKCNMNCRPEEEDLLCVHAKHDAQLWNNILWGSGGALEHSKCSYNYPKTDFTSSGIPFLRRRSFGKQIRIHNNSGHSTVIKHTSVHQAYKTLRTYQAATKCQKIQFEMLQTLGYEDTVTHFRGLEVVSHRSRGAYKVPLGCPSKRYRAPYGLGSTLVSNNVVLMYPEVPQYLVEQTQRQPVEEQLGFLCCTSSSTSAALKGLVRYAVSDVVCRCYNSGVGTVMVLLRDSLRSRGCVWDVSCSTNVIMLAGVKVAVCNDWQLFRYCILVVL
jgi:hypothetical protein